MKFNLLIALWIMLNPGVKDDIDKKLKESEMYLNEGRTKEYLQINKALFLESKEISYSKGIALSGYRLGLVLNSFGKFKESLEYLKVVEEESYVSSDSDLKADIYRLQGMNLKDLGLNEEAILSHKKNLILKLKAERLNLPMAYSNIGANFMELGRSDSAYIYYKKALEAVQLAPFSPKQRVLASVIYCNIGEYWLLKKDNVDSSQVYYRKAMVLGKQVNSSYSLQISLEALGNIFYKKKVLDSSLLYYKQALQLAESSGTVYKRRLLYGKLSELSKLKKDNSAYLKFLALYSKLSDSINYSERKNLPGVLKNLTSENRKSFDNKKRVLLIVISLSVLLIIVLSYLTYRKYALHKAERVKRFEDWNKFQDSLKEVKNKVIVHGLTELVELAKNGDSAFLIKFDDFYPEFKSKLMEKIPSLSLTEYEICCYKKINFNTKDIARYRNMTIKSVESKQYRIKKKIGLQSDESLSVWITGV